MEYKKYSYLIVFLLMLVMSISSVNAEMKKTECYYMSGNKEEFNAKLVLKWGYEPSWGNSIEDFAEVYVDTIGGKWDHNSEPLLNWIDFRMRGDQSPSASGSPDFGYFYGEDKYFWEDVDEEITDATTAPPCPEYLVFELDKDVLWDDYYVWGTNSLSLAKQAVSAAEADDEFTVYYASPKNAQGNYITAEEYYGSFTEMGLIDMGNWAEMKLKCEDLFGDEDDSESLHSMINLIMDYVRILVPILIILLGTVDLAKAVIAGKEDNMRKAQMDFAKRVLIGVAIFFIPILVDVIMDLATYVWQGKDYATCQIIK